MIRRALPNRRGAELLDFEHAGLVYTAGISRFPDGRPAEIFLACHKAGSAAADLARDAAVTVSIALQYGASVDTIRRALTRSSDGQAAGPIGVVLDRLAIAEIGGAA